MSPQRVDIVYADNPTDARDIARRQARDAGQTPTADMPEILDRRDRQYVVRVRVEERKR